jgi:tetratricopeptide (TPR) repeat protein
MVRRFSGIHREPLLLAGLILIIAAFFSLTTFASHTYRRKEDQFGRRWFARGEEALKRSRPAGAVEDFRNALAYSPDNDTYRLRLAQALMADHRPQEARSHLLSLWEKEPGDGTINLELARLAVMWGDTRQAVRYYHAAIYGVWPNEPMGHRLQVRFELSEYLLQRHSPQDTEDAQAELVALAAELPLQDAVAQTHLGTMLMQAGLYARALGAFRNALTDQPDLIPALKGAGESAFYIGEYQTARQYLLPVVAQQPQDHESIQLLNVAESVMKLDPFERGLSSQERARRAVRDFQLALTRAQSCTNPPADLAALLQQADSRKRIVREAMLARHPDVLDNTMSLVFGLERAAKPCSPSGIDDKALELLSNQWESAP